MDLWFCFGASIFAYNTNKKKQFPRCCSGLNLQVVGGEGDTAKGRGRHQNAVVLPLEPVATQNAMRSLFQLFFFNNLNRLSEIKSELGKKFNPHVMCRLSRLEIFISSPQWRGSEHKFGCQGFDVQCVKLNILVIYCININITFWFTRPTQIVKIFE